MLLSGLLVLLAGWITGRLVAAARDRAADDDAPDGEVSAPPDDLEPALVGLVVGTGGRGERSVVGGALLALAARRVVRIAGLDSERFTLTVPAGATGGSPFEEAVLDALPPRARCRRRPR